MQLNPHVRLHRGPYQPCSSQFRFCVEGDPKVRSGESRRVVHAVTPHRHAKGVILQKIGQHLNLCIGKHRLLCSKLTVAAFSEGSSALPTWLGSMPTLRAAIRSCLLLPLASITTRSLLVSLKAPEGGFGLKRHLVSQYHHHQMLSYTAMYTTYAPLNCSCSWPFGGLPKCPTLQPRINASNLLPRVARNSLLR